MKTKNKPTISEKRVAELEKDLKTKNRELKIEASLEKVRINAMRMKRPSDMLIVCKTISLQLEPLGVKEIRNVQTAIFYEQRGTYMNFEYYAKHDKTILTETLYTNHKMHKEFARKMLRGKGEFFKTHIKGKKVKDWIAYQKTTNVFIDEYLETASSVNYYWFSLGPVALGISTYHPLTEEEIDLFKRFLKVFELAYRRYLDIEKAEAQAREARIEASLERVRAQAMGMNRPEDILSIGNILFDELKRLGFNKIRNTLISIFNDKEGFFKDYDYSDYFGGSITKIFYNSHPIIEEFMAQIKKADDAFAEIVVDRNQINGWEEFRKQLGEKPDPRLKKIDSLYYYIYSIGSGSIGISNFQQISDEQRDLLKRFRNVFDLAYRRYNDIELAATQAREAQIEAALERVRSLALGMRKSEDVGNVTDQFFKELTELSVDVKGCSMVVIDEENDKMELWRARTKVVVKPFEVASFKKSMQVLKKNMPKWFPVFYEALGRRDKFLIEEMSQRTRTQLLNSIAEQYNYTEKEKTKLLRFTPDKITAHFLFFTLGYLALMTEKSLPDENLAIAGRFVEVFSFAYTRFLDVKNAEAQAREAEIELALERVRARTMAMQKSEELKEVIQLVYEQFIHLDIHIEHTGFILDYKTRDDMHIWLADRNEIPSEVTIPYFDSPPNNSIKEAKEKGEDFFTYLLTFEEKNKFYQELFKFISGVPEESLEYYFNCHGLAGSGVLLENIGLYIENFSGTPYSEEENKILIRFGKVFQQTYTRFLDLQKAEAQAREAQIETALERVRSRTMAMHKSDELAEVATVLFEQMSLLDDTPDRFNIRIINEAERAFEFWATDQEGHLVNKFFEAEFDKSPVVLQMYNSWKTKEKILIQDIYGAQLTEWIHFIKEVLGVPFNLEHLKEHRFLSSVFFSHGMIGITTNDHPRPETLQLIERFTKVFQQTYTRFLDLQKAEAQTRESQVQLALERVRARTMAMHKSEELSETSFVLFKQLEELGEVAEQISILIYNEKEKVIELYATIYGNQWEQTGRLPLAESAVHKKIYAAWKQKEKSIVIDLSGEELNEFNNFKMKHSKQYKSKDELPKNRWVIHNAFFSKGVLSFSTYEPRPPETLQLLERFASVFDLTYTRFLDLQKAEAQAREAQIEAALERVRAGSMAMHKSEELLDVITVVSNLLEKLGFRFDIVSFAANNQEFDYNFWLTVKGQQHPYRIYVPYIDNPMFERVKKAQLEGQAFYTDVLSREENKEWHQHLFEHNKLDFVSNKLKKYVFNSGYARSIALLPNIILIVGNYSAQPYSDEENNIIKRFANVFDQAYRRFLDLQKAEAQAREAEIEAALERVRSRTMAMQKSDELAETAAHFFGQLNNLGIKSYRFNIAIVDVESEKCRLWSTTNEGKVIPTGPFVPLTENKVLSQMYEGWKLQQNVRVIKLLGEERINWTKYIMNFVSFNEYKPENIDPERLRNEPAIFSNFFFKQGFVVVHTIEEINEADVKIIQRFVKVFEQTYTRFLDLQKAEAQAHEAKIEAALERVRSRSMAMHHTSELQDVINTVHQQFKLLNIAITGGVFIAVNEENKNEIKCWGAGGTADYVERVHIPLFDKPIYTTLIDSIQQGPGFFTEEFTYEEKVEFFKHLFKHPPYSDGSPERKKEILSRQGGYTRSCTVSKYTCVFIINHHGRRFSEEENDILIRLGKVFEQSYTRFLDLQKAETQAREAQIEAALERVRAKAMAMQSSIDFANIVETVFTELKKVGFKTIRCGIGIIESAETKKVDIWSTTFADEDLSVQISGDEVLEGHSLLDGIIEHWINQTEFSYTLEGEDFLKYYKTIEKTNFHLPEYAQQNLSSDEKQYYYMVPCKAGGIYAFSVIPFTDEVKKLMRRFIEVFQLAYTRYVDLQKAEAQARDAIKQASLDRIRAEIASMRTSEDLNRITPVIWRELKNLKVPFFRCGVYIVDESTQSVRVYLTTPDGKSLGVLNLSFNSNKITNNTVDHWRKRIVYKTYWNREEFIEWTKSMMKLGQIKSAETYQGSTTPPDSLYLHFVPFEQGMLYVGDVNPLSEEKLQLVKTLAEAFSIAYARYEDFKNLEEAKNKIEITLNELKSAQAQLIHSEKMASLGELTAGIAHEIKNPLNFVNNFSEVSRELLDEMKTEVQNKNLDEVIELIEDLKQNLDKINTHGKRADSIVKGMLLHSRGTSGEKTLTDINDLLDQYVTLAYHGLRAQDKEFNITIEKDYDKSLKKINVVPQDISRVFLNIINNACYAAYDKKKKNSDNNFSPTISVSTKNLRDKVEIRIGDNGDGIPESIKKQIFNPFFTTKPTGEGTGLGLSLSYDIVTKVHGGNIKVESEEGKGAMFIIQLALS